MMGVELSASIIADSVHSRRWVVSTSVTSRSNGSVSVSGKSCTSPSSPLPRNKLLIEAAGVLSVGSD